MIGRVVGDDSGFMAEAFPPFFRILGAMENGVDDDRVGRGLVENLKREATDESVAKAVHREGVKLGVALNRQHGRLDAAEEIFAEPRRPFLIPCVSGGDVRRGFWEVDDSLHHAEARAWDLTCSQERPDWG